MVTVSTTKCIFLKYCPVNAATQMFFSLPQMHSKCSFMATASTFKCIFLKNSPVYALFQMYFFTSGNAFQMLSDGDCFHIQMHFLKYCRVYASTKCIFSLPEMHSKCSFMVTVSTFKCSNVFFALPQMHSKCSFHGDCFHIQMSYCHNVRLPHTRTRASARTRARTEPMSQMTPCK